MDKEQRRRGGKRRFAAAAAAAGERVAREVHAARRRPVRFAAGRGTTGGGGRRRSCRFPAEVVLEGGDAGRHRFVRRQQRSRRATRAEPFIGIGTNALRVCSHCSSARMADLAVEVPLPFAARSG